ncbi:MAG: lipid-A-disaccharide synthase [Holosporales bacterium]|jgi:lipid-A-disaccharide synthase|nr:lipid-A-disaccharide synthase [Holosporales bacterium]
MKKIYIIAGEPSGDFLGAGIIDAIKATSNDVEINVVGGNLMIQSGFRSLFDIKNIAIGGIMEVIPHILKVRKYIVATVNDIIKKRPDVVLTIDSPGFCFFVTKLVRKRDAGIKFIHLVAPSVWAWRSGRAKKLAKLYDELMTLFDFEPKYFIKHGLRTTFVGHPAVEKFYDASNKRGSTLLLLPGSRLQEVKTLLPIFVNASKRIKCDQIIIPTLPHLVSTIETLVECEKIKIVSCEIEKTELYRSAGMAIVASGTATLQLALSGCPMIVCYKLSKITYYIVKLLANVKYISLVNIILDKAVVPELIQEDCTVESIVHSVNNLDTNLQALHFRNLRHRLVNGNIPPSQRIANILLNS